MAQEIKNSGFGICRKEGNPGREGRAGELCKLLESGGVAITDSAIALGKRCARK